VLPLITFQRVLDRTAREGNDIIDGLEFIRNNYVWGTDNQRVGLRLDDSNESWWNELLANRPRGLNETAETKSIRRSIICGHPLEWDRSLYADSNNNLLRGIPWGYGLIGCSRDDCDYFMNRIDAVDIWNNGLANRRIAGNDLDLSENNFWFAHPLYFTHHLESAGLLDGSFNPYEGRGISRRWNEPDVNLAGGRSVVVRDNPGFAPRWEERGDGSFIFDEDRIRDENWFGGYAVPTALFNNLGIGNSRHAGVDFRGRGREWEDDSPHTDEHITFIGQEIVSFIYGRVINVGWNQTNWGRILVIANERGRGIYMLTHLGGIADGVQRGSRVVPGNVVAYVGRSGANRNEIAHPAHLHLEYFDLQYDAALDSGVGDLNYYVREAGQWLRVQPLLNTDGGNRRNPFDHTERQL